MHWQLWRTGKNYILCFASRNIDHLKNKWAETIGKLRGHKTNICELREHRKKKKLWRTTSKCNPYDKFTIRNTRGQQLSIDYIITNKPVTKYRCKLPKLSYMGSNHSVTAKCTQICLYSSFLTPINGIQVEITARRLTS